MIGPACECLSCSAEWPEPPVITVDLTTVSMPNTTEPRTFGGIPVHTELAPGDFIAATIKDTAGQVLGYIAQSEVDRITSLPSPADIRAAAETIHEMIWGHRGYMQNLSLPTVKMPEPTPLWHQLMGTYTDEMARHVEAGLINAYSFGRGAAVDVAIVDELPVESLSAVALLQEHYSRQADWIRRPDRIEVRP